MARYRKNISRKRSNRSWKKGLKTSRRNNNGTWTGRGGIRF